MGLLPGSLPAWQDGDGKIIIHCLDVNQPVAAQMAEEEKLFVRALGIDPNND
jgi:multicomponent Na+:H+ antiporter subunit E